LGSIFSSFITIFSIYILEKVFTYTINNKQKNLTSLLTKHKHFQQQLSFLSNELKAHESLINHCVKKTSDKYTLTKLQAKIVNSYNYNSYERWFNNVVKSQKRKLNNIRTWQNEHQNLNEFDPFELKEGDLYGVEYDPLRSAPRGGHRAQPARAVRGPAPWLRPPVVVERARGRPVSVGRARASPPAAPARSRPAHGQAPCPAPAVLR